MEGETVQRDSIMEYPQSMKHINSQQDNKAMT
jgi:hypothetical protein